MSDFFVVVSAILLIGWPIWLFILPSIIRTKKRERQYQIEAEERKKSSIRGVKSLISSGHFPIVENGVYNEFQSVYDALIYAGKKCTNTTDRVAHIFSPNSAMDRIRGSYYVLEKPAVDGQFLAIKDAIWFASYNSQLLGIRKETVPPSENSVTVHQEYLRQQREKIKEAARRTVTDIFEECQEVVSPPVPDCVGVYLLTSKDYIKVGISDNPSKRVKELQTGHPHKITINYCYWLPSRKDALAVEKSTHAMLHAEGVGTYGEWFSCDKKLAREAIEKSILHLATRNLISVPPSDPTIALTDPKLDIALLDHGGWRRTRNGNWRCSVGGISCTVFRDKFGGWKYVINDKFSPSSFSKLREAKAAALEVLNEALT